MGEEVKTAQELAHHQKSISISEFFEKNRHLLGYDNKIKVLLIIVKEAVDNALDATEEARILPELYVKIEELDKEKYKIIVKDNGPGIVKQQIPKVFGSLLYGSKFHKLKQSLTGDEPIMVVSDGKSEIIPIGKLIDGYIFGKEGVVDISDKDMFVPAFDKDGKYGIKKISHLIKHERGNEVIEFLLSTNRRIKVTGCHSLFVLDSETMKPKAAEARSIKEGDLIISPKKLPEIGDLHEINILDYLEEGDVKNNWFYVYGIEKTLLEKTFGEAEIIHKVTDRNRKFFRVNTMNGCEDILDDSIRQYVTKGFLPLNLALKLGLKDEIKDCRIQTYQHGKITRFPITLEVNKQLMRILGLFVAEGHDDRRQIAFTFGKHEDYLVEEVVGFARIMGLNATIENRESSIRVKLFGGPLSVLMEKWCGHGAHNKHIPEFVFRTGEESREEFLKWLYIGYGHERIQYKVLNTVSERLANEVAYLCLMNGIVATLSKRTFKGIGKNPSTCHMVCIFPQKKRGDYELIPSSLLKEFGLKRDGMFSLGRILESLGMGYSEEKREKYVDIMSGMEKGRHCSFAEIDALASGRTTKFHTKHLCEKGFLAASNGTFILTEKARELMEKLEKIKSFYESDLCLLKVKTKRIIETGYESVYDISVPECENFVGGFGGISCHNSRGQQGIGVSGAVLYSQLTTGEPTEIVSSTGDGKLHRYKLKIDSKKNEAIILEDDTVTGESKWKGVQITFVCEGIYREHKQSVLEYLKQTAIANPYARIIFDSPTGRVEFQRGVDKLPPEPQEIQPHLYGVEIGMFSRMMHEASARSISTFMQTEFSRVGKQTADEICKKAGVDPVTHPKRITDEEVVKLVKTIKETKLTRPPTDCLSPLGEDFILNGLKKELAPEYMAAVTRPPSVYRGWPFQVEVGIAYGGSIAEPRIMRLANRVPLLYQAGDCAITKSMTAIDWKRYGIDSDKLPTGPVAIFVHIFSVWVPFTSESKEAVASYPVIIKEIKLALQEAARKMQLYLNKKFRSAEAAKKKEMFKNYSDELAQSLSALTGKKKEDIYKILMELAEEMYVSGEIGGEDGEPVIDKSTDKKPKAKKKEGGEESEEADEEEMEKESGEEEAE